MYWVNVKNCLHCLFRTRVTPLCSDLSAATARKPLCNSRTVGRSTEKKLKVFSRSFHKHFRTSPRWHHRWRETQSHYKVQIPTSYTCVIGAPHKELAALEVRKVSWLVSAAQANVGLHHAAFRRQYIQCNADTLWQVVSFSSLLSSVAP